MNAPHICSALDHPAGTGPGIPDADTLLCWYRVRNCDHQSIP